MASAEAAAAADTASGSIDGTAGMHVAVGTLQLAQRALLQSFIFPSHTSLLNRLPQAWSIASPLNVQVQGAVAKESRLAFVARLWVSDRLLATHWVRLLGPLGTPFASKYSLRPLAAGLLPLEPSPGAQDFTYYSGSVPTHAGRDRREGGGSYDFVVVAAGTWSAASEGGVLASYSCEGTPLNIVTGSLCGDVWYDPGENRLRESLGQYRDKESVLIKFQDDVGEKTRSGVGQLLSNGFISVFRSNGSVLWTKGIGGTSEVVTVSTRDGFCSEGDNRGATDTESFPPTMYRQAASGAGAAGAGWTQTHFRRCFGAADEAPPHLSCSGVLAGNEWGRVAGQVRRRHCHS